MLAPAAVKHKILEAMGERSLVAALAAIFEVVMDRVVIARDSLKCGEMRFGHRAARDIKLLANREILEIAGLPKTVPVSVEAQAHNPSR